MIDERFIILGAFINFLGAMSYLTSTLRGKTKPNKVTWLLWAASPMLAFSAEVKQGIGLISLTTFMAGFNPVLIFLASFVNKKSKWEIGKFDIICGTLSILGLILWQITNIPNIAILLAITADGLAATPTVVKSYTNPETENGAAYFVAMISGTIAILTIKTWDFAHYAFPIYIIAICLILFMLIHFKLGPKIQKRFA